MGNSPLYRRVRGAVATVVARARGWHARTRSRDVLSRFLSLILTCAKKFNSANNAAALLAAMNIGFGPNDTAPTKGTGMSSEMIVGSIGEYATKE